MASIEERRQNVKKRLKEIHEAYEENKEDIKLDIDQLKDSLKGSIFLECKIGILEEKLEKLRNSDDASSDEPEKNDKRQKDSMPQKNSGPEENSDNSSEVVISTASQNHQSADQRQKTDGAKKRHRDESENLESGQDSSFGKKKRSRHDAGSNVPAFDDEDVKIIELMRKMSKLSTERQVERLKWFPPMMKQQLLSWLSMTQNI